MLHRCKVKTFGQHMRSFFCQLLKPAPLILELAWVIHTLVATMLHHALVCEGYNSSFIAVTLVHSA